jgi:hypothetical protein
MKTKIFNKKLTLNKKTIVNLGNEEMNSVYAGGIYPCTRVDRTCERACLTDETCFPHTCSCVTYINC